MNSSVKAVLIIVGAVVLLGAAFYGGIAYQNAKDGLPTGALAADGSGHGMGGWGANLTEEQQAEFDGMTEEERRAYVEEQLGDQTPGGAVPGIRGGLIEGDVIEVVDDTITLKLDSGSSLTVYTDDDTIIAKAEGAADLVVGSRVFVAATPEADGVTTATLIVVKH